MHTRTKEKLTNTFHNIVVPLVKFKFSNIIIINNISIIIISNLSVSPWGRSHPRVVDWSLESDSQPLRKNHPGTLHTVLTAAASNKMITFKFLQPSLSRTRIQGLCSLLLFFTVVMMVSVVDVSRREGVPRSENSRHFKTSLDPYLHARRMEKDAALLGLFSRQRPMLAKLMNPPYLRC